MSGSCCLLGTEELQCSVKRVLSVFTGDVLHVLVLFLLFPKGANVCASQTKTSKMDFLHVGNKNM